MIKVFLARNIPGNDPGTRRKLCMESREALILLADAGSKERRSYDDEETDTPLWDGVPN
jgi:hypothetical protein